MGSLGWGTSAGSLPGGFMTVGYSCDSEILGWLFVVYL